MNTLEHNLHSYQARNLAVILDISFLIPGHPQSLPMLLSYASKPVYFVLYYHHPCPSHHHSLPGLHHFLSISSHLDSPKQIFTCVQGDLSKKTYQISSWVKFQWFFIVLRIRRKYPEFDQKKKKNCLHHVFSFHFSNAFLCDWILGKKFNENLRFWSGSLYIVSW